MTIDTNGTVMEKRVRRDRREEILQEATKLFSTYGYRGTSLASVAEAVGLSEPGVLHYFPSKAHLLQGVLEYRDLQDEEKYSALVKNDNFYLTETIEAIEGLVAENETKKTIVRLFTVLVGESVREDHPSHDYFVNRYTYARQKYMEIFTSLAEDGQLKPDTNIEHLATLIMAVMDGLQIQWLLDPENVTMSESFALFSKILAEHLAG